MKIIPLFSLLVALGASSNVIASAEQPEQDADAFNKMKQHALDEKDKQISLLNTAKKCISASKDREAIKECHEELEKQRKKLKIGEIDHKIERLEEKKAKMSQ